MAGDTLVIRRAGPEDKLTLEELQRRASLNNPGDREFILANPDVIEVPIEQIKDGAVYVAENGEGIQGFAAIVPRPDGDMELEALFIEPAAWRKGIGKQLVRHCLAQAGAAGASTVHVVGNPHAEGFYLACGFKMVRTIPMQFGLGLEMKLDVEEAKKCATA